MKMNGKGIRRKKSSLSEVKVAVIGAPGVGKSGKSHFPHKTYIKRTTLPLAFYKNFKMIYFIALKCDGLKVKIKVASCF